MAIDENQVVVPGGTSSKKRHLLKVAFIVVVLVLAAGVGVGLKVLQDKNTPAGKPKTQISQDSRLPVVVSDARDLGAQGKADQANKVIADALASTNDKDVKYDLYLQQGASFENQEKYNDAKQSYQNAAQIKESFAVYMALGRVAEALNDKTAAVDSYKKAIPLIDQKSPVSGSEKRRLEQKIQSLGGTV